MRQLGKRPPGHFARMAPRLRDFAVKPLPSAPAAVDHAAGVQWRMFENDALGCCTISAWANGVVQRTTLGQGVPLVMGDGLVRQLYGQLAGWSPSAPGDPGPGLVEVDVLAHFARVGADLGRQAPEVTLWAAIDVGDWETLRAAIWLFGHATLGLAMPITAMDQTDWEVVPGAAGSAAGSWGGHCVIAVAYDAEGVTLVSWGETRRASWKFLTAYLDEAYATHAPEEWIGTNGLAPGAFGWDYLAAAHARLRAA